MLVRAMKTTKTLTSVAYHEAGHAVAARQLGLMIKKLSVLEAYRVRGQVVPAPYFNLIPPANGDEGGEWSCRRKGSGAPSAYCRRLENMAVVCMAGPEAQRYFYPAGFRRGFAAADRKQAEAILRALAGERRELNTYLNLIEIRARNLVSRPHTWQLVQFLADRLLESVTMTAPEVRAALHGAVDAEGGDDVSDRQQNTAF